MTVTAQPEVAQPYLQLPATFTQPLSEDFPSDGPKLIKFAEMFWRSPEHPDGLVLDDWQKWLLTRILERYPEDHPDPDKAGLLRYRQVVVSMGRQNGKSVIGALLGLWGLLMHCPGPEVIGLASNADQATIVYNRTRFVIDSSPHLSKRFTTTGTRGITRLDKPGTYKIKPAKEGALQGIPVSCCIYDEVHLAGEEMWSAMVLGTSARDQGLVCGITTAGDDESVLLKRLYKLGEQAALGDPSLERFGFFCWEAPQGAAIDDPDALRAANPALAAGRLDLERLLTQVRTLPEVDARRYHLNQFVAASGSWLPISAWLACRSHSIPKQRPVAFTLDQSPGATWASICASWKDADGRIVTQLVASIPDPRIDGLVQLCEELYARHSPDTFAMDGYALSKVAEELRKRGYPVTTFRQADIVQACAFAYREIVTGNVVHPGDELVTEQMGRAVRKNVGDAWRISRKDSSIDIDACMATVLSIWAAETVKPQGVQIF